MADEGKNMATEEVMKKATVGFIISLIAGILILINGLLFVGIAGIVGSIPGMDVIPGITEMIAGFAAVGLIFAIIVIIGAILIYMPGKEIIGGILVLIFSILSIFIGGGFLIGLILGIIGGILGILKK